MEKAREVEAYEAYTTLLVHSSSNERHPSSAGSNILLDRQEIDKLTRAAIAELTGGSALMEKEYVQAEASFLVSLPPLANSHTFLEKLAALLDGS